jgi:hypothetical protein
MKKTIGMVVTLVFLAASASAVTYRWEDDQGTLNFTEDPGNIPQKYRKKARIVGEEEPLVDSVVEKASGEKSPEPAEAKGAAPVEKQEKKKAVYGDKDENAWKSEFARLRGELKSVDEQLGSKKALFSDPSKLSRMQYKSLEYEIKNLEQRWNDLLAKMKSLRADATRQGVPADIQQ